MAILYATQIVVYAIGAILTCYMSILQSRSITDCNRSLQSSLELFNNCSTDTSEESIERSKALRREKFYREYADHELSRIITSLLTQPQQDESNNLIANIDDQLETEEIDKEVEENRRFHDVFTKLAQQYSQNNTDENDESSYSILEKNSFISDLRDADQSRNRQTVHEDINRSGFTNSPAAGDDPNIEQIGVPNFYISRSHR